MSDTPQTQPPLPSGLQRLAMTLGLLFIIWLSFVYVIPSVLGGRAEHAFSPRPREDVPAVAPPAADDAREAALQTQMSDLEARVKLLEERVAASPTASDAAVSSDKLAEIERQLHTLQRAGETDNERLAAFTLFGQMEEAIARGDAFREHLERLRQMVFSASAESQLAILSRHADDGAATLKTLQTEFDNATARAFSKGGGMMETVRGLIRIRKIGEPQGVDDEAIIARAEAKLSRGEVVQSVHELAALSPSVAGAFAPWKTQAQRYLEVHGAMSALQAILLAPATASPPDRATTP